MNSRQSANGFVAQSFLAVLSAFRSYATDLMNLRVPHPSRFLRRVSSYARTPLSLFSAIPLRSQRLRVNFSLAVGSDSTSIPLPVTSSARFSILDFPFLRSNP